MSGGADLSGGRSLFRIHVHIGIGEEGICLKQEVNDAVPCIRQRQHDCLAGYLFPDQSVVDQHLDLQAGVGVAGDVLVDLGFNTVGVIVDVQQHVHTVGRFEKFPYVGSAYAHIPLLILDAYTQAQ